MLKGLNSPQIIKRTFYSNEEAQGNSFFRDFLAFLKYIEENNPRLTATKNLNLKSLIAINELLAKKTPTEEKILNYVYRIRSENEMPYIRTLDALAEVVKITKKEKGKLKTIKRNKKAFDSLSSRIQLSLVWNGYLRYLNWGYLQYLENEAKIAEILQFHQNIIWRLLRDFDMESDGDWISQEHTLETIRKDFEIGWQTAYGDDPELARWGTETVIFRRLLAIFDFIEFEKASKKFRLTDLGRKMIYFEVEILKEDEGGIGF